MSLVGSKYMVPNIGTLRDGQWIWYKSITSVLRRLRLASHAAVMSAAVKSGLPSLTHGIPRAGPATLVATNQCWRAEGCFSNQLPSMVSVAPKVSARAGTEYISAASIKLMPRSCAQSRMLCAAAWLTCSPNVMVPRQMGVTCRPLWPSCIFFMDRMDVKG